MDKENAKKLLFAVADVLDALGVEFFLYGGTLLGAVREKDFIEIDRDVDLAALLENLAPAARDIASGLRARGIHAEVVDHRHKAEWDGGVYAIKFRAFGEHGDLSGFTRINGKRAIPSHANLFWNVHTPRYMEELGEVEFHGRVFRCPKDWDGFLTEKYSDWRTPHTEFYNKSKPTCRKNGDWK